MTFKEHWEKTEQTVQIAPHVIQAMISQAFPQRTLISYESISLGCANLNIKCYLGSGTNPCLLRIYLRDSNAAVREKNIATHIKKDIPVPQTWYIGVWEDKHFAITEYMAGTSLRSVLLNGYCQNMTEVMFEAGFILSKIRQYPFPNVAIDTTKPDYRGFANTCLSSSVVIKTLEKTTLAKIKTVLERHYLLLPDEKEQHLVHGDYDPANILVDYINGRWEITAILDWEFSFSGSVLWDVANMLRYAHQMPAVFESAFLEGLRAGGVLLPQHWHTSVHLMNILALLDCLARSDPEKSPNRRDDIVDVIHYTVNELEKDLG